MTGRQPRYTPEDAARRGEAIYARDIEPTITAADTGRYVAIDLDSEAWEMDADEDGADDRLLARMPDAQIYMTRVGYGYIRHFRGGRVRHAA